MPIQGGYAPLLKGFAIGAFATFSLFLLWAGFSMSNEPYGDDWVIGAPIAIVGGGLSVVSLKLLINHFKK